MRAALADEGRLEALRRTRLLDTAPEEPFDRLTRLVCRTLGAPVTLVSLVEADRQFFKSVVGLPEPWSLLRQTSLLHSFCRHVVANGASLLVQDARGHPLVADNLAVPELGVLAYLGMPLATADGGHVLGTLCAIDTAPRDWTPGDVAALRDLAAVTMGEVTLHRLALELEDGLRGARARRLEALRELGNGVAHDLSNVMQCVQSGVRLAEARLGRDPDTAQHVLALVGDAARRGGALRERFLSIARCDELRAEPVDALALLRRVGGQAGAPPSGAGAPLRVRVDAPYKGNMAETLRLTRFEHVDLADPFFDSLKQQYGEFPCWFAKKAKEPVYVIDKDGGPCLRGFVYLKLEDGSLDDIEPPLPVARRLKVGTLKIMAHGTRLGERVLKVIFDYAVREKVAEIYITVFDTHASLIELLKRYGFEERAKKRTPNGVETVLVRPMTAETGDIRRDYPFIHAKGCKFWLLAIRPEYHSNLLPNSLLGTGTHDVLGDVLHTNTIHRVYIAKLALTRMGKGDVVVTYRTTDIPGRARVRSVATSVCVVEEVRSRQDFASAEDLVRFAQPHSALTEEGLRNWYGSNDRLYALKMTYNAALPKCPNRDTLLKKVGISEQPRWGLREFTRAQFEGVMEVGQADESLVVD